MARMDGEYLPKSADRAEVIARADKGFKRYQERIDNQRESIDRLLKRWEHLREWLTERDDDPLGICQAALDKMKRIENGDG